MKRVSEMDTPYYFFINEMQDQHLQSSGRNLPLKHITLSQGVYDGQK